MLQQYLPLAVLKLQILKHSCFKFCCVATVLTACGIETVIESGRMIPRLTVATVLTACGIETLLRSSIQCSNLFRVATVLTACGIETLFLF